VFTSLPVGPYRLVTKMSGFTASSSRHVLRVGESRSVTTILKIGAMTDTIKVVADASLVETRGLSVGAVTPRKPSSVFR
jgi:hypothetical protein